MAGKKIYFFHFYVVIMTNKRLNEYMNISLDDENLKIDGRVVAKVTSKASFILKQMVKNFVFHFLYYLPQVYCFPVHGLC